MTKNKLSFRRISHLMKVIMLQNKYIAWFVAIYFILNITYILAFTILNKLVGLEVKYEIIITGFLCALLFNFIIIVPSILNYYVQKSKINLCYTLPLRVSEKITALIAINVITIASLCLVYILPMLLVGAEIAPSWFIGLGLLIFVVGAIIVLLYIIGLRHFFLRLALLYTALFSLQFSKLVDNKLTLLITVLLTLWIIICLIFKKAEVK